MTGKNAPGDVTGGVFPFCGAKFGRKPGIPRYLLVARRRLVLGNQIGGHPTPVLNVISLLISSAWLLTAPKYPAMPAAAQPPQPGPDQASQSASGETGDSGDDAQDDEQSTYA